MPGTTKREPFFECVFACERNEYHFRFRAWTAEQAEQHLRDELRTYGVSDSGELRVLDARGNVSRRSPYQASLGG